MCTRKVVDDDDDDADDDDDDADDEAASTRVTRCRGDRKNLNIKRAFYNSS